MNRAELEESQKFNIEMSIERALEGTYTPLINAIIKVDVDEVNSLINNGANVNEKDSMYDWCPMKWATFVYEYGPGHRDPDVQENIYDIVSLLSKKGARNEFDSTTKEDSYDFYPVISKIGGRRRRKTKKTRKTLKSKKTRKGKKSHKMGKKSTTKRRKHMKK